MKWTKYTIETTTEAVDLLSAELNDLGFEGIEIEDNVQLTEEERRRMFIDILPELPPDEGIAKVSFYSEEKDEDTEATLACVNEMLDGLAPFCNLGARTITVSETEDKDWINNWKEFFKPFRVDEHILIQPTWTEEAEVREGDIVVEIDPGTAFGTGAHETTKLCILALKKYLKKDDRVLDVGCGSGILSIMGMKLGASSAVGVDIDENAAHISVENSEINHIETKYYISDAEKEHTSGNDDGTYNTAMLTEEILVPEIKETAGTITFLAGNVMGDEPLRIQIGREAYELVVANILADVIIPLSEVAGEFMKKDALFISSGIINTKRAEVEAALLKNGFEIKEVMTMGDWVCIISTLKAAQ